MANIRVNSKCPMYDGMSITFKAPCDCTVVEGLILYDSSGSQTFSFRDTHGNALAGLGNLFSEGAYVKAVLDTTNGYAYLQNADTNAYLEKNLRAVERRVGDIVASVRKDFLTETGGKFLACDGSTLRAEDYPELVEVMAYKEAGTAWTSLSDTGIYTGSNNGFPTACRTATGRIIAFAFGSSSSTYAGAYSDDNGETWIEITNPCVGNAEEIILLGTGRLLLCGASSGVLYSDDDGLTWTQSSLSGMNASQFAAVSDSCIYVAAYDGIYKSTDEGVTWEVLSATSGTNWRTIAIAASGRIVAGTNTNGVKYSDDDGGTWTSGTGPSSTYYPWQMRYVGNDEDGNEILVFGTSYISSGSTSNSPLYRSADGGATWSSIFSDRLLERIKQVSSGRIFAVACQLPASTSYKNIYYSDDLGLTWTDAGAYMGDVVEISENLLLLVGTTCYYSERTMTIPDSDNDYIKVVD